VSASRCKFLLAAILTFAPTHIFAGEAPVFQVTTLDDQIIYTVDSTYYAEPGFRPHIRFPVMDKRADGVLRIAINTGQAHGVYGPGKNLKSYDNGWSWVEIPSELVVPFRLLRPPGQLSRGFTVNHYDASGFTSWMEPSYISSDGGNTWYRTSDASFDANGVTYVSMYHNIGEVVEDGDTWLITAFGMRQGVSTYEIVLFASTDSGLSWTRRATIAQHVPGQATSMGSEGPSEGDIVRLDNGDLLSVFRTGQPFPTCDVYAVHPSIFWSISSDHGYTWSPPKMLGTTGQQVKLNKLNDGSVVMIYGRYGGKLMFADETGRRWTKPFVIYNGPSCGTVDLVQADDGNYVFSYAQSSFYNTSYDPESYDVSWTAMDFSNGVEIEFRARETSGTTTQSAAVVMAGDGTGYVAVELTASGVQLQGLGGNEGQVRYDFDSSQWTVYRLTVGPDPQYSGQIRAELYVDGVYRLGNFLSPTPGMDFIRIGDVTGTNNGSWDLDWLRFRESGAAEWALQYDGDVLPDQLPEPWNFDISGPGNAYIVNDGSLDYLHLDTGANGLPVSLYYTLLSTGVPPPPCYVYEEGGEEIAHMRVAILDIQRLYVADDYDWFLEYHGDVRPDDLAEPWLAVQVGQVDTFLWADQGQDYLRFDSGDNGESRFLYYMLSGAGSSWQAVDFAQGMVLELRCRVTSPTTTQGAANVFLADGTNGHIVLELTGAGVNLEGQGGNAGQVTYSLDSSEWHTYRLVVRPDPDAGDQIQAKLFLDGDYSSPILVQSLNPNSGYDEIRIGDQTSTNNGAWDVDFLRVAEYACPIADLNGDCLVNLSDFTVIADRWLQQYPPADLNGDSIVDRLDLAIFTQHWLEN